jgi:hypothetical protein
MIRKHFLGGAALAAAVTLSGGAMAQTPAAGQPCNAASAGAGNCNSGTCSPAAGHAHVGHGHLQSVGSHLHGVAAGLQAHAIAGAANPYGNGGAHQGWVWHSTWGDYWARNQAAQRPWHGGYYWMKTGQPTALVVPPTVTMQSNYSWGVSQNTMTPVYHQFGGNPPNGAGGGVFRATPYWPTHTDQIGVYPVRGPW